ncbi:sugar transporter [Ophiostoma piceae UAMH 11346]|uniref:Sugar transporter n=1 Tax=Ophiostoma piceae (strain UAMH 11346) TaxID=1262450 RepID=S3BYS7_OPHP1|nr:sugar transporter [Ophiostoma piceae UAMH 11346]
MSVEFGTMPRTMLTSATGFMSGVLLADDFLAQMDYPTTFMKGFITSIYELGCLGGCLGSFIFSEKHGRKTPIMVGTVLVIIGAVLQTAAYGQAQFMVGRVVSGLGTGLNTSIIPIWQAETLPAKTRELFGSFQYILVCFGATTAYWCNYGLSFTSGPVEWRLSVALQMVSAILMLVVVPTMPESPRWLMAHNRISEAVTILCQMHGTEDEADEEIQTDIQNINQALELESRAHSTSWADIFHNNKETQNLRRVMLGWWLMAMVMLSGVCSIGYYISYIFETSVGLSHELSLLLSGFNGMWYMASAVIPPFIIPRIGKRGCLMLGAFGMGCCFLAMALGIRDGSHGVSIIVIIAFFLYYTFFAIGYLAVPWLYCAEIMPLHLRSKGNALTTSSNWLWNFATVMMTPSMMENQGWKGYLIFTVFNFAFIPAIYLFFPETTGRRLEQIDAIFYKTSPIVSGTQWAKRGKFESDFLENALAEHTKGDGIEGKVEHVN